MESIDFKESNKTLTKPEDWTDEECQSLKVYNDGKHSISCWKPTIIERIKLLFTGKIWVFVWYGNTSPPICIDVNYPFKEVKNNE
jgi:hypothetical protein